VFSASKYDQSNVASPHVSDSEMLKFYNEKYSGPERKTCTSATNIDKSSFKNSKNGNDLHQIFLLPHTHDDVGWQYTIFGYFNNSVRSILDTVTSDLGNHPTHRFIWSEIKWIEMWWPLQNKTTQSTFKRIVANGQFEFVGAGWSQSDEVTPSYRDMIQNTVTGHEYLRSILGPLKQACPKSGNGRCIRFGWQIDMFAGYSATTPSLWANAGYDGMVIRFEGPDNMRNEWDKQQNYEYLWEGSNILQNKTRIATHTIRWNYGDMLLSNRSGPEYGYRAPKLTFNFDTQKINTKKDIEDYAESLVEWSKNRGSVYRGNRHLAVWGSDFQFTHASMWFTQMDLIMKEINENTQKYNATIQYTTLAEYFDHLHSLDEPLPVIKDLDFEFAWPHSWSPEGVPLIGLTSNFSWQYQTGATSSRHSHKKRSRESASMLRSAQAAYAQAVATSQTAAKTHSDVNFQTSWDALGVVQHHDSMPGTMRTKESVECIDNMPMNAIFDSELCPREPDPNRHVLSDYILRLNEADNNTNIILKTSIEKIANLKRDTLVDETNMKISNKSNDHFIVFNPTLTPRSELKKMIFNRPSNVPKTTLPTISLIQMDGSSQPVVAQIVVNDRLVTQNTVNNHPPSRYLDELYFVTNVPPLGTARYQLTWENDGKTNSTTTVYPTIINGIEGIGLRFQDDPNCLIVEFNADDTLASFIRIGCQSSIKVSYRQTYKHYLDGGGGAYCLIEQRSAIEVPHPYKVSQTSGPIMQEVVHSYSYSSGLSQRTRIIQNDSTVHIIHNAGRLPSDRELVSSIASDINNYQISNKLPIVQTEASGAIELYSRIFNATSSIAQNYHSMVQTAVIRDEMQGDNGRQLNVITRRTMGVASLNVGEIEYMLMRRITSASDNQGPWPLDDKDSMEDDEIRLMIDTVNNSEEQRFVTAIEHENPLVSFYYDSSSLSPSATTTLNKRVQNEGLPKNVWSEIMVRENAPNNQTYVIRLQNVVPNGKIIQLYSLSNILSPWKLYGCTETTLTMIQSRAENNQVRLIWNAEGEMQQLKEEKKSSDDEFNCDTFINLSSLDIRTFVFGVATN
jgi:hypothetical protein